MFRSCLFVINFLRDFYAILKGTIYACMSILIMCTILGSLTQLIIRLANLRFSIASPFNFRRLPLYHLTTVSD